MKEKFELEYILKTSPRVLESKISTASGLSEWFADDVNNTNDLYVFSWDGQEEEAKLLTYKANHKIKFQWIEDIEEGLDTYFEIAHHVDPMTQTVNLIVTDFAYAEDKDTAMRTWDQQINALRRLIGA
jgi:uncharacterized protein YndB with AHSA1/START domain